MLDDGDDAAAAGGDGEVDGGGGGEEVLFKVVGLGIAFALGAVEESGGEVVAFGEEPGGKGDDAGLVVVQDGEDPGVGFASENGDAALGVAVGHCDGVVPKEGKVGEEVRVGGFFEVGRGGVAEHLQAGVVKDEEGGLVATGAHAHGVVVVLLEVGAVAVGHRAWGVVHGAGKEACKGEANVILDEVDVVGGPFGVFQSEDAFVGEHVGIGA